jgi:imidazolonepropionase
MNSKQWDALWIDARLVTCDVKDASYGLMESAAIAVKNGRIVWLGQMSELPGEPAHLALQIFSFAGKCITPGFIDCHTHLVYAGDRSHEFEMRLQGASYEMIAREGGGIRSTVAATRAACEDELFEQSVKRARTMLKNGVTTIEIKSGYGLDLETELKILRVAKRLGDILPLTVVKTFLGAHAVPQEFDNRADDYIHYVCESMLPKVIEEKLADCVDVFCETIGFDFAQTERVFVAAKKYNLALKCHAEQLSDLGGSILAARFAALSVDHLEFLSEEGVRAIKKAGTVAVLLPGAFYFLRETQRPPISLLRQYGVPMAIATDCNPGTSPIVSLLLILNMACTLFRMTPEEALLGVTRHAAKALGLENELGTLAVGKRADFVVWDVSHPAQLSYYVGGDVCLQVVKDGVVL